MKMPRTRIAATVADQTLAKGTAADAAARKDYAREVAAYLLAERRTGELDSLLRDVQAAWASRGYVEVLARSAHPLTDAVKADITAQVKAVRPDASKVVVTEVLDPTVIGSVRLELANQQLDLSVAAKLNKFKQLTGAGKE